MTEFQKAYMDWLNLPEDVRSSGEASLHVQGAARRMNLDELLDVYDTYDDLRTCAAHAEEE